MREQSLLLKLRRLQIVLLSAAFAVLGTLVASKALVYATNSDVELISGNGNAKSGPGISISGDGRYIAFHSTATNLDTRDNDSDEGVFVYDRENETITLVSVAPDNTTNGNGRSMWPSISSDGRYVVFESIADNLVTGDTNGSWDVFVHDRDVDNDGIFDEAGFIATTRVSLANDGSELLWGGLIDDEESQNLISNDGRYVVFLSYNQANESPSSQTAYLKVFVRDRSSNATLLASVGYDGLAAVNSNYPLGTSFDSPEISRNGRYVAFSSNATNLVSNDTNGLEDVFVRDLSSGTTVRVSVKSTGDEASGGSSYMGAISDDGRYIAFASTADNLDGPTTGQEVFVHDRDVDNDGIFDEEGSIATYRLTNSNGASGWVSMSDDGRYIAFDSYADNLVPNDNNDEIDVFVHDRSNGLTRRVSINSDGIEGGYSSNPAISGNGFLVAFYSYSTNLAAGDNNGVPDVFLAVLDSDGDGVQDVIDTCPNDYNAGTRQNLDTDGDRIHDACDNCPYVANGPDQTDNQKDTDGDGIGDACEIYALSGVAESASLTLGEPLWERICVQNKSAAPITIIQPDCFNITTRWTKNDGTLVVPNDRHGKAYGIPNDLITLSAWDSSPGAENAEAQACVSCEISDTVAPENLAEGDYKVDHTYTNWVQDPKSTFLPIPPPVTIVMGIATRISGSGG